MQWIEGEMCMVKQYLHYVGLNILSEERRVAERGVVQCLIKNRTGGETDGQGEKANKEINSVQTKLHSLRNVDFETKSFDTKHC
jgi:hypothetical protein